MSRFIRAATELPGGCERIKGGAADAEVLGYVPCRVATEETEQKLPISRTGRTNSEGQWLKHERGRRPEAQ